MPLNDKRVMEGIAAMVVIAGKDAQIVHARAIAENYVARHPDCGRKVEEISDLVFEAAVRAGMPVEFGM